MVNGNQRDQLAILLYLEGSHMLGGFLLVKLMFLLDLDNKLPIWPASDLVFKFEVSMELKKGDRFEMSVNQGIIPRTITLVGSRFVEYLNARRIRRVCLRKTFVRWAKGAELVSRTEKS